MNFIVSDETVNTLPSAAPGHGKSASARTLLFTGNTFLLPETCRGQEGTLSVYDLFGNLCTTLSFNKNSPGWKIDIKASPAMYIVEMYIVIV